MREVETKLADWQTFFTCHRIHTQCHPTLHVCEREHLQHALSYPICTYNIGNMCIFTAWISAEIEEIEDNTSC